MRSVHIPVGPGYDILIGAALLSNTGRLIKEKCSPSRIALITDSTVDALYADAVLSSLAEAGLPACKFVFPAGKPAKIYLYTAKFWLSYPGRG